MIKTQNRVLLLLLLLSVLLEGFLHLFSDFLVHVEKVLFFDSMFVSFLQEKVFWSEFNSFCTISNMVTIQHITWYNKTIDLFKFYQHVKFVGGYRQVSSQVLKMQILSIRSFFFFFFFF